VVDADGNVIESYVPHRRTSSLDQHDIDLEACREEAVADRRPEPIGRRREFAR